MTTQHPFRTLNQHYPPMKTPCTSVLSSLRPLRVAGLLLGGGLALASQRAACAAVANGFAAVGSRTSSDYVRTRFADGSYQPESYAFGEGGLWAGPVRDASIDKLRFIDVARTIAAPLAGQYYLPARDPSKTMLLIMVYWGTTTGWTDDPHAIDPRTGREMMIFNSMRDRMDFRNARMLGYDAEGVIGTDYGRHLLMTPFHHKTEDLVDDIEDNRYFVVLMAYDFQLLWKQKKAKLLWETRFSIRQQHNNFDEQLAAMADYASRYFGQDTQGLVRRPLPEGKVTLGVPKVLDVDLEKN